MNRIPAKLKPLCMVLVLAATSIQALAGEDGLLRKFESALESKPYSWHVIADVQDSHWEVTLVEAFENSSQGLDVPFALMKRFFANASGTEVARFLVTPTGRYMYGTYGTVRELVEKQMKKRDGTVEALRRLVSDNGSADMMNLYQKFLFIPVPGSESAHAAETIQRKETSTAEVLTASEKVAQAIEKKDWDTLKRVYTTLESEVVISILKKSNGYVFIPISFWTDRFLRSAAPRSILGLLTTQTGYTLYNEVPDIRNFLIAEFGEFIYYRESLKKELEKLPAEKTTLFTSAYSQILPYTLASASKAKSSGSSSDYKSSNYSSSTSTSSSSYSSSASSSSYMSPTDEMKKLIAKSSWNELKNRLSSVSSAYGFMSAVRDLPETAIPEDVILHFVGKADLADNSKFLFTASGKNAWSTIASYRQALTKKVAAAEYRFSFLDEVKQRLKSDVAAVPKEIVRIWISSASQDQLSDFAKDFLPQAPLSQDPALALGVAFYAHGDSKVLRRINRYLLSQDHTKDSKNNNAVMWKIIRHVVETSDIKERQAQIRELVDLYRKDKHAEVETYLQKNVKVLLPDGYEMLNPVLGMGKNGSVALVKRMSDGALFAWKKPSNDHEENKQALLNEVKLAQTWRDLGLSKMDAFLSEDSTSLFKTYIPGPTLKKLMLEKDIFSHPDLPEYKALQEFISRAVIGQVYVSGVNSENLIFDGTQFQIIDTSQITEKSDAKATYQEYRTSLIGKWSRGDLGAHQEKIEAFFDDVGPFISAQIQAKKSGKKQKARAQQTSLPFCNSLYRTK